MWYRPDDKKFTPEHIDEELCTHIVYRDALLDPITLTIKVGDQLVDLENEYYRRVTDFKKRGIVVLIAMGGWLDSADDKYSRLLSNDTASSHFVRDVVEFIEKHNFDGLELDWKYPVCWQTDCSAGDPAEKQQFTDLVRKLSETLKRHDLLLSTVVSPRPYVIDVAYDIPELSK